MTRDELLKRVTTVEGVRPPPVPVPPPGVYWLKAVTCGRYWIDEHGTRLEHPAHLQIWSVDTWELGKESDWFLAAVDADGSHMVIGSEMEEAWEGKRSLITRVGPRVDPPKREDAAYIEVKRGVAYMEVPRCDSCAHWTLRSEYVEPHGACTADAIGSDCNDYTIIVPADFGCVQWKAK